MAADKRKPFSPPNYPSLDAIEIERIHRISRIIMEKDTTAILKEMLPSDTSEAILSALCKHCEFTHGALLVFASSLAEIVDLIRETGFSIEHIFPSVIVKKRICERYGLDEQLINIQIVKGIFKRQSTSPKWIELFLFPQDTPGLTEEILHNERSCELETHFAFQPINPDIVVMQGIINTLKRYGSFSDDGGGRNPFEGKTTTPWLEMQEILYLSRVAQEVDGSNKTVRIELNCASSFIP